MNNNELIDRVAKELRLAYAEAEPRTAAHIAREPWESLPDYRKDKWLIMARRAVYLTGCRMALARETCDQDELRAGIEHLTRVGYSHTPDCVRERERGWLDRHPDCGRCWEDSLYELLNPNQGEN